MVTIPEINESEYKWWVKQLEVANVQWDIDPSIPENIYGGVDGIAFDSEKVYVRSRNRDHILFTDKEKRQMIHHEFIPFSNMTMFPSDFKGKRINECELLEKYLKANWEETRFFKDDLRINIANHSFREVDYQGIDIYNSIADACDDFGLRDDFLIDWRRNVFRHIRKFCDLHLYNENNNDRRAKEMAQDNPHWPYRPSIENGFVRYLQKTPPGKLRRQLLREIEEKEGK